MRLGLGSDVESLSHTLVTTPPPGVDFSHCVPDINTTLCCIDMVTTIINIGS